MSSYLSSEYKIQQPMSPGNIALDMQVLSTLQGKYDTNKAKIDQTLALYNNQLKGLRAEDNEYIANRLNEVDSVIEQYKKKNGNLAYNSTTDTILSTVKGLMDDPIIKDAVKNKAYFDNYEKQVQEIKKKGDGRYADVNYQDGLKQGGYYKYLKGEVKSIGNLQYQDYVDVVGNFNKKAEEYTKARGLKEQYLGTEQGTYQTTDKYGVVVTAKEIQNYLYSNIDDKSKAQMQINARAIYENVSDADYKTQRKSEVVQENNQLKLELATNKAIIKSLPKEQADTYKDTIAQAEEAIKANDEKIEKNQFTKDEIYSSYNSALVKGIAANYDIDIITKREKNNLPFEVMKFETEVALKERELLLKQKANQIASGGGLGTATEKPKPTEEVEKTGIEKLAVETHRADAGLDAYLKRTDSDYVKMSPQEQWNYKLSLDADNPVVKGANAQFKNLVDSFKTAQSGYAKIVDTANTKLKDTVRTSYNSLIGGKDLNVKNLSSTMPLTAKLIASGRAFDTLGKEEQIALTAEFASNNLQYNDSLTTDVRKVYEKVVVSNKALLSKIKTAKSKELQKDIATSTDIEEVGGFWSTNFNLFKGLATNTIGRAATAVMRDVSYPFRSIISGEDAADDSYKESEKAGKEMQNYAEWSKSQQRKGMRDFWGGEDTNITELERRDTRKGKDIQENFAKLNTDLDVIIKEMSDRTLPNLQDNKAFTFSTADKQQAPVALALRAAVLNSDNPEIPAGTNDYTVYREGEGFRISFINKEGDDISSTYVSKLPSNVVSVFDTSIQNWANNPMNPNINLKPVPLKAYQNPTVRDKEVANLIENVPLPREVRIKLKTNPSTTAFATIPEYKDTIQKTYGKPFYDNNKEKIDAILNNTYKAVPVIEDGMFYMSIVYNEDGDEKTEYFPNPIGAEKDDHIFNLKYREAVAQLRDSKIAALNTK